MATIKVAQSIGKTLNTRFEGKKLYNEIVQALKKDKFALIDMENVEMATQGFADESIGKLVKQLGWDNFKKHIQFQNTSKKNKNIIEYVVVRRCSELSPKRS